MRICKIYDGDYPWDVRVEKIVSSLVEHGHEVHLVCRNLAKRVTDEFVDKIHIHRLPAIKNNKLNYFLNFPAFFNPVWIKRIFNVVKQYQAELIIIRDLPMAFTAIVAARYYNIPVIFDMAENYPAMVRDTWRFEGFKPANLVIRNPFILDRVEAFCVRLVNSIFVVTQEAKSRLIAQYQDLDESRIHIVSNTPKLSDINRSERVVDVPEPEATVKLIYIGGLQAGRNLEVVIRGMALNEDKLNCSLTILGNGEAEAYLRRLVDHLGIRERVFFKGWIEHELIGKFLADCDIGIVPHPVTEHTNTTVPNKLFDYMAYAKPVLASDTKPVQRIVEAERCGLIYKYDSPEDFRQKLIHLADPMIRAAMGFNGRQAIEKRYNWWVDSGNLLEALEKYYSRATNH